MNIENLNLSALKYFLDAVELQSITLSSERNHVSRPAVSKAILRIEEWCGKKLLSHEKRLFSLTDDGVIFYRSAKKIFENMQKDFNTNYGSDHSLRLGCSASLIDLIFPRIQTHISKCPQPIIKIGTTHQLIQQLEQNQINLAFLISTGHNQNFKSFQFHSGNFELRSNSGHLTEPLVITERRTEVEAFLKFSIKNKKRMEQQIEVESWTIASRLAEMTNGTCLVPDYLPRGKLKCVSLKNWKFRYTAKVIYKKEAILSDLESDIIKKIDSLAK